MEKKRQKFIPKGYLKNTQKVFISNANQILGRREKEVQSKVTQQQSDQNMQMRSTTELANQQRSSSNMVEAMQSPFMVSETQLQASPSSKLRGSAGSRDKYTGVGGLQVTPSSKTSDIGMVFLTANSRILHNQNT